MSKKSERTTSNQLTLFAVASPAKTLALPAEAQGSTVHEAGFGESSCGSSSIAGPRLPSSKTLRVVPGAGCPRCGAICTCMVIERAPWALPPETWAHHIDAREFLLLPTLTASNCGTSNNGCPGDGREAYRTKGRSSLYQLARDGVLPTLTVRGNNNRKGISPKAGDGLATALGGQLSPTWSAWFMGFPLDWLNISGQESLQL